MTARHPNDAYLTPPCAAVKMGRWLICAEDPESWLAWDNPLCPLFDGVPWLDPFAGAGTLLGWATGDMVLGERPELHAYEADARWLPELGRRIPPMNIRVGRDSFAMEWIVRRERPHIITNPPFGRTCEAVERCRAHARTHRRWACVLMRTDWWQHQGRQHLAPDHFLALEWRPVFGLNKHGKFSTDYAGYVWCVWEPHATGSTRMAFLARPEVPQEMVAEHRRLARMAHEMGRGMARGA